MEMVSLLGILAALALIIVGSMRSVSLIILSSLAALIVAFTGGINVVEGYAVHYMGGVGNAIVSLFPIFLGGQLFGKLLDKSGLTESIANSIVRKLGIKGIVTAVFAASWILIFGGVNVFVIIFTIYPMACSFFKIARISRSIIPACVLGAAVSMQTLPGTPTTANVLPTEAFQVAPSAGPTIGIVASILLAVMNLWYLNREAKKSIESGEGFEEKEGENFTVDLNKAGLPNPLLAIIPLAIVIVLLNIIKFPAWASLYWGAAVLIIMFFTRYGGSDKILDVVSEAAKGSMSVITTAAIVGFGSIVSQVSGYKYVLDFLTKSSFGNPYIYAAIAVAVIAGITGSATGGIKFVLAQFAEKLVAMGGNPAGLARIITISSLTFDSLPHNSAIVLTLNYCGVTHKEGYKYLFVTTVLNTTIVTIIGIIMASMGIY